MTVVTIVLTGGTSWPVPSDFNPASNTVHCIAGGGGGSSGLSGSEGRGGGGGGGGGYARLENIDPGEGPVSYSIGAAGAVDTTGTAGSTSFGTFLTATGGGNTRSASGGTAGSWVLDFGVIGRNGGDGGSGGNGGGGSPGGGGGAGGAGGRDTSGGSGSLGTPGSFFGPGTGGNGGAGGSPGGGAGGTTGTPAGGNGTTWEDSDSAVQAGPGGGGRGGDGHASSPQDGGASGQYGAGGGGGGGGGPGSTPGAAGKPGVIVIQYEPLVPPEGDVLFSFGGARRVEAVRDGDDLIVRAGVVGTAEGVELTVANAFRDGRVEDLTIAIRPGDGLVEVWRGGERVGSQRAASGSFGGGWADSGVGGVSVDLRAYDGQRPRQMGGPQA